MNVVIDGVSYAYEAGSTVFQFMKSKGIDIPSLCAASHQHNKQPCGLCVVEIDGLGTVRSCEQELTPNMCIKTHTDSLKTQRHQALKRILSDHNADCEAPCQIACPAHVDIQTYLHHIAKGEPQKAIEVIKKHLPLPASIGRVCPAFCESECRRSVVDEPIAIRHLKRHAADIDLDAEPYQADIQPNNGKKVAIVGAGPGGLACGYYLSLLGFSTTVYEEMPKAGGWLRYGIPEYRLPKDVLDKEIELLTQTGLQIHCNQKIGENYTLAQLEDDYDAVCLAIGASLAVSSDYPGSNLGGCYLGVDYLKDAAIERKLTTGKRVAIIGGGNTAIDCARTALRLGAKVTLIYRRTMAEMPAEEYEIEEAQNEGVAFQFLANPIENLADKNGHVRAVRLEKMMLGQPDTSGRRQPIPTGEVVEMKFDTVISAISQKSDTAILADSDLPLTRRGTADVTEETLHHARNVFSIGDFRRGPATAIEAIADGKRAAEAIAEKLLLGGIAAKPHQFSSRKEPSLSRVKQIEYRLEAVKRRIEFPHLPESESTTSFNEVELDAGIEASMQEAQRCLECGCQASTQCDLRDYASEYKVTHEDVEISTDKHRFPVDKSSEFIVFDANRCISCGLCVQTCQEDTQHGVLQFTEGTLRPQFANGESMGGSNCVQCGACVQVCPTGALADKRDKSYSRVEILKPVKTICTYCGVGCNVVLYVDEKANKVRYVEGDKSSPVNQGMLCVKGRFGFDFIHSPERLTQPLIRQNGKLVPTSWENAIETIAKRFTELKQKHGNNALGGFSSAKTTNQDNYLFQKLIRREFGTNNVDHCARLCHASTVTGLEASIGSGAMTNDIASIQHSDVIFVIGSDTTSAHPIIASHLKQAVSRGAKLIVADPKRIGMADVATLHIQQRPGTDVMLLNGVMQQIIQNAWYDKEYIRERVDGFDDLVMEVMSDAYLPEKVELVTGVKAQDIKRMAEMIGTAKVTAVYYAMGITQHTTGHDNVRSIANLQMLCGNIGVEGGGINPLRGQSNVQGACDMGALPTDYPGYQKVLNPLVQTKFAKAWQADHLSTENGLTLTEMIDAAHRKELRGLYVMGENPVLSDPNQAHVIEALKDLDFLVVQDIFLSETAELADVVLPSASFAEKRGHFTNTERRVQALSPAIESPGQAKQDWWIITQVANAMGGNWQYQNIEQINAEMCEVTPQYAGIAWDKMSNEGIQWPCNDQAPNGTRIMHQNTFKRGRGEMVAVPFVYAAEMPDDEYPLILTTGRLLEQFHTGTMTRKTKGLDKLAGPRIMISVQDAEALAIKNSEMVRLHSRRGVIEAPAFVTKRMQQGVVFVPFHFAEAPANRLTSEARDPYAKIPEFKVSAVRLEKMSILNKDMQKIGINQ
ncbi:formate dehydrogenase subunit alpha [Vibrio ziniensis]|uniref:Formate dehydrogenase subunit alpha n=1 Tax=Vibrio ziniensis TaxID=2711221 RepID=A0A6G7CNN1_9VIBR|nr:formate dehydrogenase subunit alpha [Vibrio ziniensis]QIH43709.1 formate dehydrogenase subunit alpha [Vibrio ziniensis]